MSKHYQFESAISIPVQMLMIDIHIALLKQVQ